MGTLLQPAAVPHIADPAPLFRGTSGGLDDGMPNLGAPAAIANCSSHIHEQKRSQTEYLPYFLANTGPLA